jgi:hypothetical protein
VTAGESERRAVYGGVCRPQDGWHLDEADQIRMKPDLGTKRRKPGVR